MHSFHITALVLLSNWQSSLSFFLPTTLTTKDVYLAGKRNPSSSTTPLHMSSNFENKFIARRYIYRLSPTTSSKSSPSTQYTIEERQYYSIQGVESRYLEPVGKKSFFIRGGEGSLDEERGETPSPPEAFKKSGEQRQYLRIGPTLHKVPDISEGEGYEDGDSLGNTVWDSSYVMALYIAENPDIIKGNGLELGSGVGIGGLMSAISAGLAQGAKETEAKAKAYQSIEDIAMGIQEETPTVEDENTGPSTNAPVPDLLAKLTLTDSKYPLLEISALNVRTSKFPMSKVEIAELDWNSRVPNKMRGTYDFIIGCDIAYYFPLVNPLARTVAYSLQVSPYDKVDNNQRIGGQFVMIGPEHRENIRDVQQRLTRGYKMNTSLRSLELERFDLVPLLLDSIEDDEFSQMKEEVEGEQAGFVECQSMARSRFSLLLSHHNEDYDGYNGEMFFPAETGNEGFEPQQFQ